MNDSAVIDAIAKFLTSLLFNALVNVTQIVGLVITFKVYLEVKRIKRYYTFVGRLPDLIKSLKQHSSNIIGYLNDFEGFLPQIQDELTLTEVVLQSLEKKVDGQLKQSIRRLLKTMKAYDLKSKDKDGLRSIYTGLSKVDAEITEFRKDQQWEMSP